MNQIVTILLLVIGSFLYAQDMDMYSVLNESEAKIQQERDSTELTNMIDSSLGNSDIQFKLGFMYRTGQRPDERYIQVTQEIGILDYISDSFQIDYEKAFYWLSKSAKNGNIEAINDLAIMYDYGQGISENPDSAFYFYYKAAEKCLPEAQNNLARLYFLGKGSEVNYQKSYAWASIAYKNGSTRAAGGINMLEEELSVEEIKETTFIIKEIEANLNCSSK